MSKVFGGIKKGAAEASASAAIEARLLKAKQSGFDHPPEVEEQMNVRIGLEASPYSHSSPLRY